MARHMRRSRLTLAGRGVAAGTTLLVTGVFIGQAGAAPLGSVVPLSPPEVGIADAIQVSRENPTPHSPAVSTSVDSPARRVARVLSPCTAKRSQLKAVETELRAVYRTPTALELAEDAGVIAKALHEQCDREGR